MTEVENPDTEVSYETIKNRQPNQSTLGLPLKTHQIAIMFCAADHEGAIRPSHRIADGKAVAVRRDVLVLSQMCLGRV